MRLSRFTDISLRALMYLGAERNRPVPASEMSHRLSVSQDHLLKGLRALAELDLVRSVRGRGGGYMLGPACSEMRLGHLVGQLEPSMAMAECFEPVSTCPLTGTCGLAGVLADAQRAFLGELDRRTVADLVRDTQEQLVRITPTH